MASDFDAGNYTEKQSKPAPIILLLDTSGSMFEDDNIGTLNKAVEAMLMDFAKEEIRIMVSIITFDDTARIHCQMVSAPEALEQWRAMDAGGMTSLGAALTTAKNIVEDRNLIPSKCYRPMVVLVSDGAPNDSWEGPMNKFINDGRSLKCDRHAMAIGAGSHTSVLEKFLEGTENKLISANDAASIFKFFKTVTMTRTNSAKAKQERPRDSSEANGADGKNGNNADQGGASTKSAFDDLF